MNLIDHLNQMQSEGKSVVSISFILNSLALPQNDYCEFCEQLPRSTLRTWRKPIRAIKSGGG